jgi:hypothetical protein
MFADKLDTLLAYKAIALSADLSTTEKRVASALIDSFNYRTTQCDPSLGRIAKLLGVHRRTVIRAWPKLEASRMFRKVRHGGKSHRNSYEPVWSRFRELDAQWKARFGADKLAREPKASLFQRQTCQVAGDVPVTQTSLRNQSEETKAEAALSRDPQAPKGWDVRKGHSREAGGSAPGFNRYRRGSSISASSFEAARAAAERRWTLALHKHLAGSEKAYGEAIEMIDETLRASATDAELRRDGSGLAHVLLELSKRRLREPAS